MLDQDSTARAAQQNVLLVQPGALDAAPQKRGVFAQREAGALDPSGLDLLAGDEGLRGHAPLHSHDRKGQEPADEPAGDQRLHKSRPQLGL